MSLLCQFIRFSWHRWSQWERYSLTNQANPFQIAFNESWQRRTCERCGYTQERRI